MLSLENIRYLSGTQNICSLQENYLVMPEIPFKLVHSSMPLLDLKMLLKEQNFE